MTLKELRAKRTQATDAAAAIKAVAKAEDREWTEDETSAIEGHLSDIDAIDAEIIQTQERMNHQAELAARLDSQSKPAGRRVGAEPASPRVSVEGHASRHDEARGFAHVGEFALAVKSAQTPGMSVDERLLDLSAAATGMSQGSGPDGGYMVPPSFSTQIWDGLNKTPDNLLSETDNYTVDTESLTFNANAETSRATGSRYGGIRGYWLDEAAQMTSSSPKVRQVKLEPHGMGVLAYVTDKLLKNATALSQYLSRAATDEINFLVNDAIIEGTGVGKPLGILNSKCVVEVAKEGGQGAATIVTENINKMWSRLHAKSRANAKWYINQDCEPQLQLMTIGVGAAGQPVYLPPGGLSQSPYATLMGRPIVPIEYCNTVGTAGDIILADLSAYATGTKGGVEEAMSMHLRFDYNETAFRFLFEVDGQPWLVSPITPFKGTNTTSPFVKLATRA